MTGTTLDKRLADLDQKVNANGGQSREALMAELASLTADYNAAGLSVPQRLKDLETFLEDDAVEDQFDNMPL